MEATLIIKNKDGSAICYDIEDKNKVDIEKDDDFIIVYIDSKFRAIIRLDNLDSIFLFDKPKVI